MADREIPEWWNPKHALKENSLCIDFEAYDFASEVLNKRDFKIWRKREVDFLIIVAL